MTVTNPSPIANPFNQHQKYISSFKSFLNRTNNPKSLTVPESQPYAGMFSYSNNSGSNLQVPNSDIPYYDSPIPIGTGFIQNSSYFRCSDGVIIDLNTHKIVHDPNVKFKRAGYWNDPNETTSNPNIDSCWGRTETIEQIMAKVDNHDGTYNDPNLSPTDIKYWKKAKEESLKLQQNMTDEQKKLLDQLQSEQFFPMTKLVEESKKH